MVAQDGRILALDQDGTLRMIRANPKKFDLVESRRLTENDTWAHLAVAGDMIFVRELKALVGYRWAKSDSPAPIKPKPADFD